MLPTIHDVMYLIQLPYNNYCVAFHSVFIRQQMRNIRNHVFCVNNISILSFDQHAGEHYYPGLWERATEDPSNSIAKQGLSSAIQQLLENSETAVIIDFYPAMYYQAVKSRYCNWGFLNDRFYPTYLSFPLPKGSPFVSVFSSV